MSKIFKIKMWGVKGDGNFGVFRTEDVKGLRGDLRRVRGKRRPMPIVSGLKRHEAIAYRRKLVQQTGVEV